MRHERGIDLPVQLGAELLDTLVDQSVEVGREIGPGFLGRHRDGEHQGEESDKCLDAQAQAGIDLPSSLATISRLGPIVWAVDATSGHLAAQLPPAPALPAAPAGFSAAISGGGAKTLPILRNFS